MRVRVFHWNSSLQQFLFPSGYLYLYKFFSSVFVLFFFTASKSKGIFQAFALFDIAHKNIKYDL